MFFNWLSLAFAPISLLPRLTNPDGPLFGSWSIVRFVALGNSIYYAALCKLLQLVFHRLSRNPLDDDAAVAKASSASAARHISDSAFDLRNI